MKLFPQEITCLEGPTCGIKDIFIAVEINIAIFIAFSVRRREKHHSFLKTSPCLTLANHTPYLLNLPKTGTLKEKKKKRKSL